jgi:hypothetical protein
MNPSYGFDILQVVRPFDEVRAGPWTMPRGERDAPPVFREVYL